MSPATLLDELAALDPAQRREAAAWRDNATSLWLTPVITNGMSMRIMRASAPIVPVKPCCLAGSSWWCYLVLERSSSRGAGRHDARWAGRGALPTPAHVVVVVEENRSAVDIIGNKAALHINSLAMNARRRRSPSRSPTAAN